MDRRLRDLERRALNGDRIALERYRALALKLDLIPQEVIIVLTGLGYQPAREIIPRYQWPNSTSTALEQLFHNIPHNAENAACIAYRVISPAVQRVLERKGLEELLNHCIPSDIHQNDIFLKNHDLMEILQSAFDLITQMADCEYLYDLFARSSRAYSSSKEPWNRGWQYSDSLVLHHYQTAQRVEQITHALQACASSDLYRGGALVHLPRAVFAIADSVKPPVVGFIGQNQLSDNIFRLRYFLDGMDYSWVNEAYIEAIFSFYLI